MTKRNKYGKLDKLFENRNCEIGGCKFPASRIIKVDGQIAYICGTHFALISDMDYVNRILDDEPTNKVANEQGNDNDNDNKLMFNEVKGNDNGFER